MWSFGGYSTASFVSIEHAEVFSGYESWYVEVMFVIL